MWIEFTILGQPPSKSNSYRVGKVAGHGMLYKSKELKKYEEHFQIQIPSKYRGVKIEGDLCVSIICFFSSRRPDLDNAAKALLDCLQNGGVIKNDRSFIEVHLYKKLDKDNPRAIISIYRPK